MSDTHQNAVKGANVYVNHLDASSGEVLAPRQDLGEKFAGTNYETSPVNIYGYTVTNATPQDYKGVYGADDITVTYLYQRNIGEIKENTESITKTADRILNNVNSPVEYKISYNAEVINFVGTATTIIKDTPIYKIDKNKTQFDANASYDEATNTITWTVNTAIDEEHRLITFNKTFNIYYVLDEANFDGRIVNNVSASTTYDNAGDDFVPSVVNATASTEVAQSSVTVKYIDEASGRDIKDPETTTDYVGRTIDTSASDIYGYTLKENTPSSVTATYAVNETTVVYEYTKNPGVVTASEVSKIGDNVDVAKNEIFTYTLTYKKTIKDFEGVAKTTIVDTLPYEIIELDSDLQGGVYNPLTKTITWEFNTILDEQHNDIEFIKTIKVKYSNFNANSIKNSLHGETKYDDETTFGDSEATTKIAKSNITAIYIDKDGNELRDSLTTTGLVSNLKTLKQKTFTVIL